MILAMLQFEVILLVLWPVLALAQAQPAGLSTNCTSKCGIVTIPFPFGIEEGCSMDGWLKVDCNHRNVALHGTNGSLCLDFINDLVELFNFKLISLVDELNKDLHDAKLICVNIYGIALIPTKAYRIINSPPCCEVGANISTTFLCVRDSKSCKLFKFLHLFGDAIHPSETSNIVTGARAYHALFPYDTYPIDIHHLDRL
ncbi:hypothetical protein Ddye_000717 [Dipteronia dyeriana]|uniref:Wall-associated receptor kinase galacturonan-binding domain-containing protein n=1 Tax=Dipteronia dyeriana TaxID=168575 RepID=A0AAE0CTC4_9ROSI|nr:hypothetical protein Ddye_000717 [Dipteronia dyeriana]